MNLSIQTKEEQNFAIDKPLLEINDLHVGFRIKDDFYDAVDGVSLTLEKNEILAIVGESGCGKSTLATSIALSTAQRLVIQGQTPCHSLF